MKNFYGETVKPEYAVELRTWSSMASSVEQAKKDHDMESFDYISCTNYRDAVKQAKAMSMRIGEMYGGCEIVDVCIACFYADESSSYNRAWREYYENGKKDFRTGREDR